MLPVEAAGKVKGSDGRVASNDTREDRAKNRRVLVDQDRPYCQSGMRSSGHRPHC